MTSTHKKSRNQNIICTEQERWELTNKLLSMLSHYNKKYIYDNNLVSKSQLNFLNKYEIIYKMVVVLCSPMANVQYLNFNQSKHMSQL